METLSDYLKKNKPRGSKNPAPYYSPEGDSLSYLFKDESYYGERIDDLLTVYRSQSTEELIGCQIKGVANALDLIGSFGLTIAASPIRLSVFFALLQASDENGAAEHFYFELSKSAKGRDYSIPLKMPSTLQLA